MAIRYKGYSISTPTDWERADSSGFTIGNIDVMQNVGPEIVVESCGTAGLFSTRDVACSSAMENAKRLIDY